MAVLLSALKSQNGGRLEPALLFPDEEPAAVDQRLQKYIDEGVVAAAALTGSALDAAVKLWAYHRAFEAVWIRLSSQPSSVTLNDQGSGAYLVTQIQNFKDLSDAALAEFEVAIDVEVVVAPSVSSGWNVLSSLRHG